MKSKIKKQERHLKCLWFGRNFCNVFSAAFGFGFFFCGFMGFTSDDVNFVMAMLMMFLCGFSFVLFSLMEIEFAEHYKASRDAYMAENIEKTVKKARVNNLYEGKETA